ncbi:redoxin domain-containing protein [Patescibacteria group bacterium]|nr:redoxin domain-containing protein [Patescibacteria group bacterium]MBU1028854.1 redoxin domain-containing protein [Patescibacteria group bacterium]MBU1915929.1 redoxin domain-containing protein [Patescibacteria group bacterium]
MMRFIKKLLGVTADPERVTPGSLPIEGKMPEFVGITGWLNSPPLAKADLSDRVVLVNFWTLSCINSLRPLPYLKTWHERYTTHGLTIIGIHSPEFAFENRRENVDVAVQRFDLTYPVALDPEHATWNAYRNHYWPAYYFIDRAGNIRHHFFGEGSYEYSEQVIRALLQEDGTNLSDQPKTDYIYESAKQSTKTPEMYLGYARLEYLGSPESIAINASREYSVVKHPALNIFYLAGEWEIKKDYAVARSDDARLVLQYQGTEVNIILEAENEQSDASFVEIKLDGKSLNKKNSGADVKMAAGRSMIRVIGGRLYQAVSTPDRTGTHLLELDFPRPGIRCYTLTFG